MQCSECDNLENIRYDCILRYVALKEAKKRAKSERSTAKLDERIVAVEQQLNEVWEALAAHRRRHLETETTRARSASA